jgi:hypothetical protein
MGFGGVNNVLIQIKTHGLKNKKTNQTLSQTQCSAAVQPTQLCTGGCRISISGLSVYQYVLSFENNMQLRSHP